MLIEWRCELTITPRRGRDEAEQKAARSGTLSKAPDREWLAALL